jgi:ribose 5-phosphate isomerase B
VIVIRPCDYLDHVVPLGRNVARGEVERAVAICGSGVGACVTANKVKKARAALVHDIFSAHQGVEDDDMNVICFGARARLGFDRSLLGRSFHNGAERHQRRQAR